MFSAVLMVLLAGLVAGTVLTAVAAVKTVRYHGWGKQTWAPPAVPWFWAGFGVLAVTLIGGIIWAAS